jgi:hypothetical protein
VALAADRPEQRRYDGNGHTDAADDVQARNQGHGETLRAARKTGVGLPQAVCKSEQSVA